MPKNEQLIFIPLTFQPALIFLHHIVERKCFLSIRIRDMELYIYIRKE